MLTYCDISKFRNNEGQEVLLQDMDKLCDSVSENQKESIFNMIVSLLDYFEELYKVYKKLKIKSSSLRYKNKGE